MTKQHKCLATLMAMTLPFIPAQLDAQCIEFNDPVTLGIVEDSTVNEASGLVASVKNEGVYWTHNDSGDDPKLYAMTKTGKFLGTWTVEGTKAKDWEDIAYGPCADGERGCLYIADFGNNAKTRDDLVIYRLPEPIIDLNATTPINATTQKAQAFPFKYPESVGIRNAEALLVDTTGDIYVATKDSTTHFVKFTPIEDQEVTATLVGQSSISTLTGGDLSPDGTQFVLRGYLRAWIYDVAKHGTIEAAFAKPPIILKLKSEPQGESITYAHDGGLVTLSEKTEQPLIHYPCKTKTMPQDMGMDMTKMDMMTDMVTQDMSTNSPDMAIDMNIVVTPTKPLDDTGCTQSNATKPSTPLLMLLWAITVFGLVRRRP